jgi:hypothetical protein
LAKEGHPAVSEKELLRRERRIRRRLKKPRTRRGYPSPFEGLSVTHEYLFAFGRELAELLSSSPKLGAVRLDIAEYLPDLPDSVVELMAAEAMTPGHANTRVVRVLAVLLQALLPAEPGVRSPGVHYSTVRSLVYRRRVYGP